MSLRTALLNASVPIQKLLQKCHPPYALTTVKQAETALLTMLPGDILLSREAWHLTNGLIAGFWSHAAIFGLDAKNLPVVVEAVAPCVQIVDWRDWVIEKHNWCVLRPRDATEEQGFNAFDYSTLQKGILYDYQFSSANKTSYCSELVYDCWDVASKEIKPLFNKVNSSSIVPEDFYKKALIGQFKVVHEHRDKRP